MFSLVIPTHNRAAILERSLANLMTLEGILECEVITVDDGSTDNTPEVLRNFVRRFPNVIRTIRITNGGPGRARNCGLQAASQDRILFVDDDVFPRRGMLQHHKRLLDEGYSGSQGMLLWHKEVAITPLIRYIDSRGSQFAFDRVTDPLHLDFAYVYTGNLAVSRKAVLEAGGFDETFFNRDLSFSAFEDTILGYKLVKNGATLALNREAIGDHLHDMTEDGFVRREYKVGYAIGLLREKYPTIAKTLGLDRKDFMVATQARLLAMINTPAVAAKLLGYPLSMRLRVREAFCRGFLLFKSEYQTGRGTSA